MSKIKNYSEFLNEGNPFKVGDFVKFKKESIDNMEDPRLIDLNMTYVVVDVRKNGEVRIDDDNGSRQRIPEKDLRFLTLENK